jgi:hypothetical protein
MWMIAATLISSETRLNVHYIHENKDFYAAESAIELAIGELNNGGDGNLSGVNINGVTVNTSNDGDSVITVVAVSPYGKKVLRVNIEDISLNLPEAFYYMASSFAPGYKFEFNGGHSPYISGSIFSYTADKIKFDSDVIIDEANTTLECQSGITIENKTPYTVTTTYFSAGETPLEFPTLDTQYYDDYLNNVGGYPNYGGPGNRTISTNLDLADFTDRVLYHSGGDIKLDKTYSITGPGVIVCTDKIIIDEDASVGPNVHIIAQEDLEFKKRTLLSGMESVLFSYTKVKIVAEDTWIYGSMISPTRVELDQDSDFDKRGYVYGIIYNGAPNKAKIKHCIIRGSIVSWYYESDEIHCTHIIFDESYLPPCPPGFTLAPSDSFRIVDGSWRNLVFN